MSGRKLFDDICALLAIRKGSIVVSLSLPHPVNGCFNAVIS
jgi:hypothetical protein